MTAYTIGVDCPEQTGEGGAAKPPKDVPADESNI
jgi:4,5-DOPA dioxygenase extradiol